MWIASKHGFFSIVLKEDGYHLRARVRKDLENLLAATDSTALPEIETWPSADYRFRVRLDSSQFAPIWKTLGESIDYPNFKSEIAKTSDQRDKLHTYHEIWSLMMRHQSS